MYISFGTLEGWDQDTFCPKAVLVNGKIYNG